MSENEWSRQYNINIADMDFQHEKCVLLIAMLEQEIVEQASLDIVQERMNYCIAFMQRHFEAEENLMRDYKYPAAEEHRASHIEFMKKLREQQAESVNAGSYPDLTTLHTLQEDFKRHILDADRLISDFLDERAKKS